MLYYIICHWMYKMQVVLFLALLKLMPLNTVIVSHQVSLKLDEQELDFALQDKTLMSAILSQGLPK